MPLLPAITLHLPPHGTLNRIQVYHNGPFAVPNFFLGAIWVLTGGATDVIVRGMTTPHDDEYEDEYEGEGDDVIMRPPEEPMDGQPDPLAAAPRTLDPDFVDERDEVAMARAGIGPPHMQIPPPGYDDSVDKARHNFAQAREWAAVAELYRTEPEEFRGKRTKGFIRKFQSPFDVVKIREWARQHRGGGKYKMLIYDGGHVLRTSNTFEVEGDPMTQAEVEAAEHIERTSAMQSAAMGFHPQGPPPPSGPSERERELEKRLAEERTERLVTTMQSQFQQAMQQQNANMMMLMEKLADRPEPKPAAETLAPLMAALAPVLAEVVKKPEPPPPPPPPPDNTKEIMAAVQPLLAALAGRPGGDINDTILKAVLSKAFDKGNDPSTVITESLGKTLPNLFGTLMETAMAAAGHKKPEEPEEFGPKYLVDRGMEAIGKIVETRAGGGGGGMPSPFQPGVPVPGAGAPGLPAPAPMGGQPHVPPQPMMTPDGVILPRYPTQQEIEAGMAGPNVPPGPAGAPPAPPDGAPAPPDGQHPGMPPAPQPPQQQWADVNPQLFVRAIAYLNEGKNGSELAHDVIQENDGKEYLSPRIVTYLVNTPGEKVAPMILQMLGNEPSFRPLLDPIGKSFVLDFCTFFSDHGEDDDEIPETPDTPEVTP